MHIETPAYFPFYPLAFSGDKKVEAMSTKAVGAYALLLCKAWQERPVGTLPDDDKTLAAWARVSNEEWNEIGGEVKGAFRKVRGRWLQKRMRDEYRKIVEAYRRKSDAGKKGAESKWRKHGRNMAPPSGCQPPVSVHASDSDSESSEGSDSRGECERGPKLPSVLDTPEFHETWARWVSHRRKLETREYTPMAIIEQWRDMAVMGHARAVAAMRHSMQRNWATLIEATEVRNGHSGAGGHITANGTDQSAQARHVAREQQRLAGGYTPEQRSLPT